MAIKRGNKLQVRSVAACYEIAGQHTAGISVADDDSYGVHLIVDAFLLFAVLEPRVGRTLINDRSLCLSVADLLK